MPFETRSLEIIRYHFGAWCKTGFYESWFGESFFNRFFRNKPAPSITVGLDVFVQLVIAAITTEPWVSLTGSSAPISTSTSWLSPLRTNQSRLLRSAYARSHSMLFSLLLVQYDLEDVWDLLSWG